MLAYYGGACAIQPRVEKHHACDDLFSTSWLRAMRDLQGSPLCVENGGQVYRVWARRCAVAEPSKRVDGHGGLRD